MTAPSLYFFDNRREVGDPVPGRGRVPQRLGLSAAWQLVNVGFYCKQVGRMPVSLSAGQLQRTAAGWLSIRPGVDLQWEPFDEFRFLNRLKQLLIPLWTGRERLPDGKGLADVLMNYPHPVTRLVDQLDQTPVTLIRLKWELAPYLEPLPEDWRLLFVPCPGDLGNADRGVVVLPAVPAVFRVLGRLTDQSVRPDEREPLPFAAYDRFAAAHSFLDLPQHGRDRMPSPDRLRRQILTAVSGRRSETGPLQAVIPESSLDRYSLELFLWLMDHLPIRIFVPSVHPFSETWAGRLSARLQVWNPWTAEPLPLHSGVVSHFRVAGLQRELHRRAAGRWGLALSLLCRDRVTVTEETDDTFTPDQLERMGLLDESGARLPRSVVGLDQVVEQIGDWVRQGDPDVLRRELTALSRHPGRFQFYEWLLSHVVDDPVAALMLVAAGQWERAADRFLSGPVPEGLLPWAARALRVAGREADLEKLGPGVRTTDTWRLVQALGGEACDPTSLDWPERFELRLVRDELDALETDLETYGNAIGEDDLYLEMTGTVLAARHPDQAIAAMEQAVAAADAEGKLFRKAMILKRLGNTWFRRGDFPAAEACYLEAMELQADLGNRYQYEAIAYNRAMVDLNLCRLDQAEDVLLSDLSRNRKSDNRLFQVYNLKALAKSAALRFHFDHAEALLTEAGELAVAAGLQSELPGIYYIRASVLLGKGELDAAESCIRELASMVAGQAGWEAQLLFLQADLARKQEDMAQAAATLDALHALELEQDDGLYREVLDALIHEKPLAAVSDLYMELAQARLTQLRMFGRTWLLDRYPSLVHTLPEACLQEDLALACGFNDTFAGVFRRHLAARRRGASDPELMADLQALIRHAREREATSFYLTLDRIGSRTGVRELAARPCGGQPETGGAVFRDAGNRVCLSMADEPEADLVPFFRFLVELIAGIGLPRIGKPVEATPDEGCPYLSLIVGRSAEIQLLKQQIQQASRYPFPVLILGESGTGKELAARAVHACSDRRERPFVAINCAALPDNLIESELFGSARGAFTGATVSRAGLFESAGDGTIFMDEIGELPAATQAKLLRVLQEREYYRLGESRPRTVQARFVFATNRDLSAAVQSGTFREDLYYRIAGLKLTVPSLNERRGDIPLLARHFLATLEGGEGKVLAPETLAVLERHTYRGNIRELQNLIMAGIIHAGEQPEIRPEHLPESLRPAPVSYSGRLKQATRAFQRQYIRQVLEQTGYNNSEAARLLGITRQRVIQLRKELDIQP